MEIYKILRHLFSYRASYRAWLTQESRRQTAADGFIERMEREAQKET